MDSLDWNQLKALLKTAETGSLSAAARKLGLTQPTLSRQVAAIERRMGVPLLERVGTFAGINVPEWKCQHPLGPEGAAHPLLTNPVAPYSPAH